MKNIILLVGAFFVMCTLSAQVQVEAENTGGQIANWESTGSNVWQRFANSTGYSGYIEASTSYFNFGSTSKDIRLVTSSGGSCIWTNSDGGRFGIDNSSPSTKLHVTAGGTDGILIDGNDSGDTRLSIENGGGTHYLFDDDSDGHNLKLESANDLSFNAGGPTERVVVEGSTGDVGIGEDNPAVRLHVYEGSSSEIARFEANTSGSGFISFYNGTGYSGFIQPTSTEFQFGTTSKDIALRTTQSGGNIQFETENVERARVDATGLGVGVVPVSTLHVEQQGTGLANGFILQNDSGGGSDYWQWEIGTNDYNLYWDEDGPGGTDTRTLLAYVEETTGAWTEFSDRRLKENINYMNTDILDKVMTLKPATYNYKHDKVKSELSYGFIAQEVGEVFPGMLRQNDSSEYYALNYDDFAVVAIKAIQEQQKLIEALEARIEQLETEK